MVSSSTRAFRISGLVFFTFLGLLLLRAILHRSSNSRHSSRLRVEEPVVLILVHPSPSLTKAANFELKRAISRTWAKDVEDLGAGVFFVGEHDGETVMRRPSEFQGRAQSLSSRFGPEDIEPDAEDATGAGGTNPNDELIFSKESSPMRKMLIPSVLENGRADDPPGLLKTYHFLYNNTNWYAGPIFQTYPFILTTDTTHYIHVENLVSTLLSSRPKRLLTMRDDQSFEGLVSEASACSPEDIGDKPSQIGSPSADSNRQDGSDAHWTLSRTHLISKQLVAMLGPHLQRCVKEADAIKLDSGKAFQACVKEWASSPQFWRGGYCGRMAALRYQAPTPGGSEGINILSSSSDKSSYGIKKERRGHAPSPEEFEAIYQKAQEERAANELRIQQTMARKEQQLQRQQQELQDRKEKRSDDEGIDSDDRQDDEEEVQQDRFQNRRRGPVKAAEEGSETSSSPSRWIVGSGLTHPIDFTLLYQSLVAKDDDDIDESEEEDYLDEIEY
ncbi:hypothetical protein BGZ83_008115 [Gryganskiella cystojenkinii]|nr:hypothetical protein BGZ83_008115 [Gryganskiella cystojenkinii]